VLVSNACFGMMSKAARWARYEATKAAQYASQITLSAVPGFLRFDYAADALSLEKVGRKLGFSQGQIERALGRLDLEAECCSQRFKQAAQELHNVPGASKKIEEVFNGNLKVGNVKGAAFELESALQQLERGEEIVAIGYKHGDKEFDVMTKTKLIECKHWHWDAKNAEDISELEKALKQRQAVARQLHKKLVVHSKKPVPSRLRKWLQKNKIDLLEG
jgi:hypothetical protein